MFQPNDDAIDVLTTGRPPNIERYIHLYVTDLSPTNNLKTRVLTLGSDREIVPAAEGNTK
jgi:hypothetical protein